MQGYCRAVPEVGGLELGGRLVRTAAAGVLGQDTVSMPSLRLALTSDSYRKIESASLLKMKRRVGGLKTDVQWDAYLETLWYSNSTTEASKTELLNWDNQLRLLTTILCCILCRSLSLLSYIVCCSSFTRDDYMTIDDMQRNVACLYTGNLKDCGKTRLGRIVYKVHARKKNQHKNENEKFLTHRGVYSEGVDVLG